MMRLSEEQTNIEWSKFCSLFQRLGLDKFYNMDELKEQLYNAPCAVSVDMGTAYKGALLVHINMVTAIAQRLSKMISGTFNIDEKSLLKVCLLMHLSKRYIYTENDNEWEIKNRGLAFKFVQNVEGLLNGGERSALEALNNGVKLTPTEFEAIKCLDNSNDNGRNSYCSILTTIVRQANELSYAIAKEKYRKTFKAQ